MIDSEISDEDARQFVGKNAEYYLKKWQRLREKQTKLSWNWAAFFFGPFWMAYRKMLLPGFLVFVLYVLIDHFVALKLGFLLQFFLGIFGNHYYLMFSRKKVRKVRSAPTTVEQQVDAIAKAGGANVGWVFVLLLMILPFAAKVTVDGHSYSLLQFLFPR